MSRLVSRRVSLSIPPMYAWPRPVKYLVLGLAMAACVSAYIALGAGLISLAAALVLIAN